jgi:hypothetical protein
MITSEVGVCNVAIGMLGGELIFSLDDESDEAKLCKANYDLCRDTALEARNWTFAAGRALLNPMVETPSHQWSAKFLLPSDCVKVRQVCSDTGMLVDTPWEKEENYILANESILYIKYTKRIKDPARYSSAFIQAFASLLASLIAVPLTGDVNVSQSFYNAFAAKVETAGGQDGVQGKNQRLRTTRLIRVRTANSVVGTGSTI